MTGKKDSLNKARVHCSADILHCSGAGDLPTAMSMETQRICVGRMGVPGISHFSA